MRRILALALLLPLAATAESCLVVGIVDGDTVDVRCGAPGAYQQIRVRLAEVDTPERGQPFGTRAKQATSDLCYMVQAEIRPTGKVHRDRAIAHVECRGQDAGSELVRRGLAWADPRYQRDSRLSELEAAARARRAGLWADAAPVAPWKWRRTKR